jgi:hypothetical protein
MNRAVLHSMTEAEQRLVAETSREAMAELDEEELLALHARIRRARAKYVTTYRRGASGAVAKRGGRGFSYPKNQRDRDKAEVFETALATVSKAVGAQAAQAARELKASRLAAAARTRGRSTRKAATPRPSSTRPASSRPRGARKTTGGITRDASTLATGARRQAKRDAR